MALATCCPACETIFRISTTQAAAKSGMVRCGQCRHVFNSLDALVRVEDLDVLEEDVTALDSARTSTAAQVVDPLAESVDAWSPEVDASEHIAGDFEPRADVAEIAKPSAPNPGEGPVFSEWWLPQSEPAAAAPLPASETEAPQRTAADFKERSLSDRRVSVEWPRRTRIREPAFLRTGTPRVERSRAERWTIAALSIVAALGLAAQAAYVWRNEVAARWPAAKPWLAAACTPLHCVVDYPAHIDSITIESTALQSSGPNSNLYKLTALLRNRDAVTVRYPHLELTLTDTQDQPILRRVLRPEDYLAPSRDAGTGAQGGFAAESELPVRMMFELNDLRFVGYRLDRFYP